MAKNIVTKTMLVVLLVCSGVYGWLMLLVVGFSTRAHPFFFVVVPLVSFLMALYGLTTHKVKYDYGNEGAVLSGLFGSVLFLITMLILNSSLDTWDAISLWSMVIAFVQVLWFSFAAIKK